MVPINIDNEFINYILRQAALFGTSQFPYIIGVIFAHKKIYSTINSIFSKVRLKNTLSIFLILLLIVAHGFVQTLFVTVFTGVAFIMLFNIIDKPKWIERLLSFISIHSTNMWLTHMFFYMIYFKDLIYAPKYPILIFVWLVSLCIGASYIINIIYNPITKLLDNKFNYNKQVV